MAWFIFDVYWLFVSFVTAGVPAFIAFLVAKKDYKKAGMFAGLTVIAAAMLFTLIRIN